MKAACTQAQLELSGGATPDLLRPSLPLLEDGVGFRRGRLGTDDRVWDCIAQISRLLFQLPKGRG